MPFIPHTEQEITEMLKHLGVANVETLYDEIPAHLRIASLSNIPPGLNEYEVGRLIRERFKKDKTSLSFLGAGAYEHHIPAAVSEIISRGEFYTAYTPYQAEASQGNLQLMYEFQTMIASLMGMDVANASVYDGATALAEAVLMAIRINKNKSKKILIPRTVHPFYRQVVKSIVGNQNIEIEEVNFDLKEGGVRYPHLQTFEQHNCAALIIPQPNFFGVLEEVDKLTDWAHQQGMLVVAVVNPISMALLKEPGQWGQKGADIACGEGQPLGIPLLSGGPYFGFMTCKLAYVRQLPGRIVAKTVDQKGREGFTLTLQAREQHIRRSKATSNICTNQGLMVTAATIYMSLLGAEGLKRVAAASYENAHRLLKKLATVKGVDQVFQNYFFHEFLIRFKGSVSNVLEDLADHYQIQAGFDLSPYYPELDSSLLVCATETKSVNDLVLYQQSLQKVLQKEKKPQQETLLFSM